MHTASGCRRQSPWLVYIICLLSYTVMNSTAVHLFHSGGTAQRFNTDFNSPQSNLQIWSPVSSLLAPDVVERSQAWKDMIRILPSAICHLTFWNCNSRSLTTATVSNNTEQPSRDLYGEPRYENHLTPTSHPVTFSIEPVP